MWQKWPRWGRRSKIAYKNQRFRVAKGWKNVGISTILDRRAELAIRPYQTQEANRLQKPIVSHNRMAASYWYISDVGKTLVYQQIWIGWQSWQCAFIIAKIKITYIARDFRLWNELQNHHRYIATICWSTYDAMRNSDPRDRLQLRAPKGRALLVKQRVSALQNVKKPLVFPCFFDVVAHVPYM